MSAVTENDLKRLEDLITNLGQNMNQRFDKVDQDIQQLNTKVSNLETKLAMMEPTFQKLPELFEKIGELKNWKTITVGVIALILGIFLRSIYNQP
jgi:prefoldin subunit 5